MYTHDLSINLLNPKEILDLKKTVAETLSSEILDAAQQIKRRIESGGKLLLMGNGGSAGDAQHIAAELVGRFKKERKAIPALALTVDTSSLTALGNDYGFDTIFERQVEAHANKNDAVIGISTSGNSENVLRAVNKANTIHTPELRPSFRAPKQLGKIVNRLPSGLLAG